MIDPRFIHLRVHSAYSLLEGAIKVSALPKLCADDGMPALALTDTGNLFGALEFSEAMAAAGLQPIHGCTLRVDFGDARNDGASQAMRNIVLLAKDAQGFGNLMRLSSLAYLECGDAVPHVSEAVLQAHAGGLICLSGGPEGALGHLLISAQSDAAHNLAKRLSKVFPERLYVEIQRHPINNEIRTDAEARSEAGLIDIAYDLDLPLVATNDVHFATEGMYESHDALLCIGEGAYVDQQEERRKVTPDHRFKSTSEMVELFKDIPEAIERTVEISRRCAYRARKRAPILPKFASDEVNELRRQASEGLAERLSTIEMSASQDDYRQRLDYELGVIERMGFPGYFLIVADFIKWAKTQGIPVGPGRGSGAGSLVAYALTITDLDPLRYGLLFERFLNPDRISMPDFDIDFCMDRREEVIAYVQQRYGRDRVAQIITFGALLSKAAVRDVGRVLQMPYGQVDRLSKMIPTEGVKPVSVEKALAEEPQLREESNSDPQVKRLLGIAKNIEGLFRNASTHAAGVVIGDRPLDELVALYRDPKSDMPATQFNMKWVEEAGLVKFDFLGLKTLTIIKNALDILSARGVVIDIEAIPLDDEETYQLYGSAATVAVFQVESAGMRDALRQLKPTCIEDIIALVALYRPGPMENIPKFCRVKNDLEPRESLHPSIDPILDETQGIIVYQEQVMEIARKMAGYSLGGADILRRAMGKKIQAAMDAEKPKFLEGAAKNGVNKAKADEVWNLLDKFANYGFNKSHAAAYAVVSYQTAWLKANHPVEFMAGVMNCDIHLTDKLGGYKQEIDRLGITLIPPSVNASMATFDVSNEQIVYALGALKNVGVDAMSLIVEARQTGGVFSNVFDFAARVNLKRIGKRALEMLARSGALDCLDSNRRKMFENLDKLTSYSTLAHDERSSAQVSLFGEATESLPAPKLLDVEDWLPMDRLNNEHMAIGFYLSGHPLDDYRAALSHNGILTYAELRQKALESGSVISRVAASVSSRQERKSARGNRFAYVTFSDPTGVFEAIVFSDVLDTSRDLLVSGTNVVASVEATAEGEDIRLRATTISPIDAAVRSKGKTGLHIYLNSGCTPKSLAMRLSDQAAATESAKRGPVTLITTSMDGSRETRIAVPEETAISPQVIGALKALPGVSLVEEI